LVEKESQLEQLAKGIEVRKASIEAKRVEVTALDAAHSESAKSAAEIDLGEEDVADQPELVAFLKSEAWTKLRAAIASKAAARVGAAGAAPAADEDVRMLPPTDAQKRAYATELFHVREGGIDGFISAVDAMWTELANKRARRG